MPIVGSFAGASARAYGLGAAGVPIVGDFESIASTIVGTATSTVTFSSIPQTYKHLQIRVSTRNTAAAGDSFCLITLNGVATYTHFLYGTGSSTGNGANPNSIFGPVGWGTNNSWNSNNMSANVVDIVDYTNTNKYKTVRTLYGTDGNGVGIVGWNSGYAATTSAIDTIVLTSSGTNFAVNSTFALYME